MSAIQFTLGERAGAARALEEMGIAAPGASIDSMLMIGYLASVIRAVLLEHPGHAALRIAAARAEMFEEVVRIAAAASTEGLYYSRTDETGPVPDTPPGVDGTQLGTRAALARPHYLNGPPEPVCLVDTVTLFCQTHQGVHVDENAQIFDLLTAEQAAHA